MAQSAMAGSGPNAQAQAKANNNSAVKAQLQSNNQNHNAVANGTTTAQRYSAPAPMDVASVAPSSNGTTNGAVSNGNGAPAVNGGENASLKHDSGLALEWSAEEQSILEEALNKHAAQTDALVKYIKIAALLSEKNVRDVALRVRWMTKKENGKRRKDEAQNATKKSKDKKDKAETTSKQMPASNIVANARAHVPMYSPPPPIDNDDGISNVAIGGTTGQLLEQNALVIQQIRSNLASMKMQENNDLLVRFRDNIFAILNGMTNMPGIMSQMPPLPVKLNTELADSILPKSQSSTPLLLQS